MDLFYEYGYENVTVRAIGRHADVTHRLVFHHFGNKESLWLHVSQHLMNFASRYARSLMSTLDETKSDNILLYQFCTKYYALMLHNPKPLTFFMDGVRHTSLLSENAQIVNEHIPKRLFALVEAVNKTDYGVKHSLGKLAWKLIASAHSPIYRQFILNEEKNKELSHNQWLREQWQVINKQLAFEFAIPEEEKLTPTCFDELLLNEQIELISKEAY
ncbi:TetR/AcrR family transcriptional regulator [Vibrio sp. Isolate22]|uniref:TetR/AcrR family transcriptional regulator n=1 Tax=Vibrio sp. Isolate22 TaxID=2908532 RepID=UPI001EFE21EB|nr:TetR/AcrR family transcriptional regulator [Vibrio sp. Isolate22]MCG9692595.1 TetR/AcrR family transcriptional regulator [Vibrio sp. Isolate22]